jgi:hypothetical protein
MESILRYRFNHNQKLIYETVRGRITFKEFIEFEKRKLDDPDHDYSYSIFADIRDAVKLIITITRIVMHIIIFNPN